MGIRPNEPITAERAVLKIEAAELIDSPYRDQQGRDQVQYATELRILSGAGERNGEKFSDWFSFPAEEEPSAGSKTGQLLAAALGDAAYSDTPAKEMAPWLVGKTFAAKIGTNKSGKYSRIIHDTLFSVPPEEANGARTPGSPDGKGGDNPGLRDAQKRASEATNSGDDIEEQAGQIPF